MDLRAIARGAGDVRGEGLAIGIFENGQLDANARLVDSRLDGMVKALIRDKDFKGEKNETSVLRTRGKLDVKRVLLVGLGKEKDYDLEMARQFAATSSRYFEGLKLKSFCVALPPLCKGTRVVDVAQAVAEGANLSLYHFDKFKTEKKEKREPVRKVDVCCERKDLREVSNGVNVGAIISDSVNVARDLANNPANRGTPSILAEKAREVARKNRLECKVLGEKDVERLGMGAFLAVAKGSDEPSKFIVMEYFGGKKGGETVAVVGKGVTFDSGGISLKPSKGMDDMKFDKSGGSAVIGVMQAATRLKLPLNVIGIIPATENMPSGKATKPGDIVKSYLGKNIEVANTDAEGRLVLADALAYANKYKPKAIIDLATLTGACIIALGKFAIGMLGNDEKLMGKIEVAGKATHERVWELPLWEEYEDMIKSEVADVRNIGSETGDAGTITAAAFLKKFVGKTRWAHLDIAGTAYSSERGPYRAKGATGVGVRLIIEVLRNWGK